jgi:hypothetical protein
VTPDDLATVYRSLRAQLGTMDPAAFNWDCDNQSGSRSTGQCVLCIARDVLDDALYWPWVTIGLEGDEEGLLCGMAMTAIDPESVDVRRLGPHTGAVAVAEATRRLDVVARRQGLHPPSEDVKP